MHNEADDCIETLQADNARLRVALDLQEQYTALMIQELESTLGIALAHGWRSSLVEQGKALREKIALTKTDEYGKT